MTQVINTVKEMQTIAQRIKASGQSIGFIQQWVRFMKDI